MSGSEFAFLALGLVLGVATGAALVEVLRARPPAPREVRLTVAPDSVPRRLPATLASGALSPNPTAPAPGGPGDRRERDRDDDAEAGVPLVGIAIHREPDPTLAALRRAAVDLVRVRAPIAAAAAASPAGSIGADSTTRTTARAASQAGSAARRTTPARPAAAGRPSAVAIASRTDDDRTADESVRASGAGGAPSQASPPSPADAGPCAEARRVADERCAYAERAKEQAAAARDSLRAAQRSYDDHLTRADQASDDADPRAVRAAKEAAQQSFRAARNEATTREEIEAAARDWLTEINRINILARDAAKQLERERAAANALVPEIERLTVAADAARIAAESAQEACLAARDAVADCEERNAARTREAPAAIPEPEHEPIGIAEAAARPAVPLAESEAPAIVLAGGEIEPVILRLVRGDRGALVRIVDELGGTDPAERRRWQLGLAGLVEAIVARAIEAATLDFPADGFWAPFTRAQNRDIVAALSSLGYRFDGLGSWMDDRMPGQRDLSLAVGYAGLDPMRIRHWPNEAEMRELFRDVRVAADEYLVGTAPGLTLGELVSALGVRADELADVWNEWGRLRPLLLAPA